MPGVNEVVAAAVSVRDAVPVVVTGNTGLAKGSVVGIVQTIFTALLSGGVLVAIIKAWPLIMARRNEREASLLEERAAEMTTMRSRIVMLEAELRATNHKLNNVTQAFEWLVDTIEFNPERAKEAAGKVRAMRISQMQAEAEEKAAILGAKAAGKDIKE